MRILVGCEWSGRVRDACIDNGHDETYSVDLEPGKGFYRDHHIQGDVLSVLNAGWDMAFFFPPCTYLTTIANSHMLPGAPGSSERMIYREAALLFVEELLDAPIPKIALENPVGVISTRIRPPDQYIQPYEFGDPWQKKTCLWLKGLPPLVPTCRVTPNGPWVSGGRDRPGAHKNSKMRGMTFQGIAYAMADQWAGTVTKPLSNSGNLPGAGSVLHSRSTNQYPEGTVMKDYVVTLPIANDLPARSVVTTRVTAFDSIDAIMLACERAQDNGYIIDHAFRAVEVEVAS